MEQEMSSFGKQENKITTEQFNVAEIRKGVYDVIDAFGLCNEQMQVRAEVIKKINDDEDCSDIMMGENGIHNLCFRGMDKEEIAGHIMHRVLVGTCINMKENRKFIFDDIDAEIADLFHEILIASSNKEIDDKIQQFRAKKGQIKATCQFDN